MRVESFDYSRSLIQDFQDQLVRETQEKLGVFKQIPVKFIKINDREPAELKHRASPVLETLILNASLGFNSLLVGPAGCGKTVAAEQVAESLKMEFGHICLTAGASETWLFGRQTPNGFLEACFSRLYRDGGVFLADELDAADPNLLLAINTALSSRHMYNPISGETITRSDKFVFIGAANTFGKGGDEVYQRSRLDGSTLDRFVLVPVDYCKEVESDLCPDEVLRSVLWGLRDLIAEARSKEIISTRSFDRAYKLSKAGVSLGDILQSLTLSWPEELRNKAMSGSKDKAKAVIEKKSGKKSKEAVPF